MIRVAIAFEVFIVALTAYVSAAYALAATDICWKLMAAGHPCFTCDLGLRIYLNP